MKIKKVNKANLLSSDWDRIAGSVYQKRTFLTHLEKSNFSNQRYYLLYRDDLLCAGAVVYSLKINLLTFSNLNLKLPMQVIGIPISIDQGGLIGNDEDVNVLIDKILKSEVGTILCLNHLNTIDNGDVIEMWSLPSMMYQIQHDSWESYLDSLRYAYRRRIKNALNKIQSARIYMESCQSFTHDHYDQYLEVVSRSKTKLEVMNKHFFEGLPECFKLRSYYDRDKLLFWNITTEDQGTLHFLFGGMDYSLRDTYDSYANNLIDIIKEGIRTDNARINLGQTAETSKSRFGAYADPKRMFLYHKNKFIRLLFKLLKRQLSHTNVTKVNHVYKTDRAENEIISINQLMQYDYAKHQ